MRFAAKLALALSLAAGAAAQLFPDCVNGPLANTTVCDVSATPLKRATVLVGMMTLQEKINISGGYDAVSVPRLGLPPYYWWNEALHGVASSPGVAFTSGSGQFNCATSFPQPILMSAAFDDSLISNVATVVSTEARAFNNFADLNTHHAGLDFWTPNINPFRDPRWGRGQETPGEDPTRTAMYIKQLVPGLQGGINPKYPRIAATCKHYAGYDIEDWEGNDRYGFNAIISTQDLSDYYMPPFQSCVRDSNVLGIMCSYNAVNGVPSCANDYLLQTVLRDFWGFPDQAHWVTSDCDAIGNIYTNHYYTITGQNASAVALNAGTDYDCGSTFPDFLQLAYDQSLYNESTLDRATIRRYSLLAKLGYFDPVSIQPYRQIGWSSVNTPASQKLAYEAAVKGVTLLKNDGTLPFKVPKKSGLSVALIDGCWANATIQMQGNYAGVAPYLISPLEALQGVAGVTINYAAGVGTTGGCGSTSLDMAAVTAAAEESDVILFMGGIDDSIEAEGMDRVNITWPSNQISIINTLATYKKPFAVFQMGGGQVDSTFIKNNKNIGSLVWGGYPGQSGGQALIDIAFGNVAPAGRLVSTMYPAAYVNEVPMTDMGIQPNTSANATNPGRTYMWYPDPVYPFGYGQHYTTFTASGLSIAGPAIDAAFSTSDLVAACRSMPSVTYMDQCPFRTATVSIKNVGDMASDYSVLAFLSGAFGPTPYPIRRLVGYTRLSSIGIGKTQTASIALTLGLLARTDEQGRKVLYPGTYTLAIDTTPALTSITFTLTGPEQVLEAWPVPPTPVSQPSAPSLTVSPLPSGFVEYGCYVENDDGPRYLPYAAYANSSNTPQLCAVACLQASYNVSGAEYSDQCYCGTAMPPMPAPSAQCNMACTGDPYQPCGGTWRMDVAVYVG